MVLIPGDGIQSVAILEESDVLEVGHQMSDTVGCLDSR
jgi:hypothetical protein